MWSVCVRKGQGAALRLCMLHAACKEACLLLLQGPASVSKQPSRPTGGGMASIAEQAAQLAASRTRAQTSMVAISAAIMLVMILLDSDAFLPLTCFPCSDPVMLIVLALALGICILMQQVSETFMLGLSGCPALLCQVTHIKLSA